MNNKVWVMFRNGERRRVKFQGGHGYKKRKGSKSNLLPFAKFL
jgi:hypothetical protein